MKNTFDENLKHYYEQQTVAGQRTQKYLSRMASQIHRRIDVNVASGVIHTMKNERTGEVIFTGSYYDKDQQKIVRI